MELWLAVKARQALGARERADPRRRVPEPSKRGMRSVVCCTTAFPHLLRYAHAPDRRDRRRPSEPRFGPGGPAIGGLRGSRGSGGRRVRAIAATRELHPDVLLLDVQLPTWTASPSAGSSSPTAAHRPSFLSCAGMRDYSLLIAQSGARGFIPKAELGRKPRQAPDGEEVLAAAGGSRCSARRERCGWSRSDHTDDKVWITSIAVIGTLSFVFSDSSRSGAAPRTAPACSWSPPAASLAAQRADHRQQRLGLHARVRLQQPPSGRSATSSSPSRPGGPSRVSTGCSCW